MVITNGIEERESLGQVAIGGLYEGIYLALNVSGIEYHINLKGLYFEAGSRAEFLHLMWVLIRPYSTILLFI